MKRMLVILGLAGLIFTGAIYGDNSQNVADHGMVPAPYSTSTITTL